MNKEQTTWDNRHSYRDKIDILKQKKMKKNYELTGMSCGGCVANVKRSLLQLSDVENVEVQLHPQSAVITMNKPVGVEQLQAQLKKAGRYTIKEVVAN